MDARTAKHDFAKYVGFTTATSLLDEGIIDSADMTKVRTQIEVNIRDAMDGVERGHIHAPAGLGHPA